MRREHSKSKLNKYIGLFGLAILSLIFTASAAAHTVVEVGEFDIIALWEIEPVVAGERNTLAVEIRRNNEPIDANLARMNLELEANDVRKPIAAAPVFAETLRYEISFIPTDIGDYTVHLDGLIGDDSLVASIAPEPVNKSSILEFPDSGIFNNRSLQDLLIGVEERAIQAEQRANIGVAVGVIGILIGVAGLALGFRKQG